MLLLETLERTWQTSPDKNNNLPCYASDVPTAVFLNSIKL